MEDFIWDMPSWISKKFVVLKYVCFFNHENQTEKHMHTGTSVIFSSINRANQAVEITVHYGLIIDARLGWTSDLRQIFTIEAFTSILLLTSMSEDSTPLAPTQFASIPTAEGARSLSIGARMMY